MDKLGVNFSSSRLIELKEQLNRTVGEINRCLGRRARLIDFKGYTNREEEEINSRLNPEDYYKFRYFNYGVELVYTHWTINKQTGLKYQDFNHYYYGIRYYGCQSDVFKTNVNKLDCYNSCIYGSFDNLDEAKVYFKKAVADILNKLGYLGLDPINIY